MRSLVLSALTLVFAAATARAQTANPAQPAPDSLVIEHSGARTVLHAAELAKLARYSVRGVLPGGPEHEFTGPSLAAVLSRAGVTLGGRGLALAQYLIVVAADSYRTVLSAGELDSTLIRRVPVVADRQDGKSLSAEDGPWRLIVPGDRRQTRWVRQVVRLRMESTAP